MKAVVVYESLWGNTAQIARAVADGLGEGAVAMSTKDATPDVVEFAETLESVCVETVEAGFMTKDLALLVGRDQGYLTTQQFLDKLDEGLQRRMSGE